MKNVIYKIENVKSGHFYIGSAIDFKARKRQHLYDFRKNNHHSSYLQRVYNKYGIEWLQFIIIEHSIADNKLLEREQYYIDTLKPQYNMAKVAGSRKGCKVSEKGLMNMSKAMKGKHFHTDESRAAISASLVGNKRQVGNKNRRKMTPELLKKIKDLRSSGMGCRKIAAIVNLNKTTILNVFNNKFNYGGN